MVGVNARAIDVSDASERYKNCFLGVSDLLKVGSIAEVWFTYK